MKIHFVRVPVIFFLMFSLILVTSCQQEEDPIPAAPLSVDPVDNPEDTTIIDPPVEPPDESAAVQEEPEESGEEPPEEEVEDEPAPVEEPPPSDNTDLPAVGATVEHQVQVGDWLMQIARCYGADYAAVRRANPQLANPNWIKPGAVITVPNVGSEGEAHGSPCVAEYTVALGDTWLGLADQFGTTAVILRRINPGPLLAADKIIVPAHPTEAE